MFCEGCVPCFLEAGQVEFIDQPVRPSALHDVCQLCGPSSCSGSWVEEVCVGYVDDESDCEHGGKAE